MAFHPRDVGPLHVGIEAERAPAGEPGSVGEHAGELVATRVGEARDAEHLAGMQREGGGAQVHAAEILGLEQALRRHLLGHLGPVVGLHLDTQHEVDELTLRELVVDRAGRHQLAVAQHRDAVGEAEDLVEAVRHVQDAGTGVAQVAHDLEEPFDLARREHGRGLVEHEHPTAGVPALQRGGDGDDRALDRRGLGQRLGDVEVDGERREEPASQSGLLAPPDAPEAGAGEAAVQGQVVDRVQLEDQAQVLVDEAQAGGVAVPSVPELADLDGLAVEDDLRARVGMVVARQHLDEGGLARAVVTDQGVHLAGADVEVDVVERLRARERLRQVPDLEDQPVGVRLSRLGAGRARLVAGPLRPHPAGDATSDAAASSRALVLGPRTWNSHRPTSGIGDSPRAEATPCRRALHSVAQIRGSATPCRDSCRDSS